MNRREFIKYTFMASVGVITLGLSIPETRYRSGTKKVEGLTEEHLRNQMVAMKEWSNVVRQPIRMT